MINSLISRLNSYFASLPTVLRHYKKRIFLFYLILLLVLGAGLPRIKVDMSLESFFAPDDPALLTMNRFRDVFQGDSGLYLVYRAKDGDVFSNASLEALNRLQQRLTDQTFDPASPLSHITRITSLINVDYLEVRQDDLISREFIGADLPLSNELREKRRAEALSHPDLPEVYFSKDFRLGAILLETDLGTERLDESGSGAALGELSVQVRQQDTQGPSRFKPVEMEEYAALWHPIEQALQVPDVQSQLEFYPVGETVMMAFFLDVIMTQMDPIFMGTLLVMMVMLAVLFRSFAAVMWPVAVVVLSVVYTFGLVGWLGLKLNMMIEVVALLLLVVGVSDAVHIQSGYLFFRKQGKDHEEAMRLVFAKSGVACLLTSLTTAVGLMSLVFVPIEPIQNFGLSASLGVLLAFLLTLFLLPLLMDLSSIYKGQGLATEGAGLVRNPLTELVARWQQWRPLGVLLVFVAVFLIFLYGFFQVRVDSDMLAIIPEKFSIRQAYDLVDQSLGGSTNLEVLLEFDQVDALKDPVVLEQMDAFQTWLKQAFPQRVKSCRSLVEVVKYSFQVLNENKPEAYRVPRDRNALAQTLLLFDSAAPEVRRLVAPEDYATGRISVRMINGGSEDFVLITTAINKKLKEFFDPLKASYPKLQVETTGGTALIMKMIDYVSWGQIKSFGLALAVISLILVGVFGSMKVGLLALLPNLFPVVVTFGVMGFLGIALDMDTLIIAPIVIGIAVDDTIHFLTHFKEERLKGQSTRQALLESTREAGQAMIFTSLILSAGFLMMLNFSHMGLVYFGALTAVALFSALLADLFMLPAILQLFQVSFSSVQKETPVESSLTYNNL